HFLDRGLATGTGDRGDASAKPVAIAGTQAAETFAGIGHHELRDGRIRHLALYQGRYAALGGNFGEVVMAVETRTDQGDEQLPGFDLAAVAGNAGEGNVRPYQLGLQRPDKFGKTEGLKHWAPPTRPVPWPLHRDRRTDGVRRRSPGNP